MLVLKRNFNFQKKICIWSPKKMKLWWRMSWIVLNKIIKLDVKGVSNRKDPLLDIGRKTFLSITRRRPYISYVLSVVRQCMHDPKKRTHPSSWQNSYYLKSSLGKRLMFKREDILTLKIYSEPDYKSSITNNKSNSSRYHMFLGE